MNRRPLFIASGLVLILWSGFHLFVGFAFATLAVDPARADGASEWSIIFGALFGPASGTVAYFYLAMIALGVYLCFRPSKVRMTVRRLMIWVAVDALVLGLLAWSASQEYVWMQSRIRQSDGRTIRSTHYMNYFGKRRVMEVVE